MGESHILGVKPGEPAGKQPGRHEPHCQPASGIFCPARARAASNRGGERVGRRGFGAVADKICRRFDLPVK